MSASVMTVQQIRDAEAQVMETVPEATLMARAADAVAAECEMILAADPGRMADARVAVLVGSGHNGGDALLAGARLRHRGANVTALLVAGGVHLPSLGEARAAGVSIVDAAADAEAAAAVVATAHVVIDGIVGIGSSPDLRAPADALVATIPTSAAVVAVDIPSGLDADSAAADAAHVSATVTVTFTAPKACLAQEPASASAGRVIVAEVGIPRQ
ncbi:NAD(P)H-hydrate epimerase [Demequina sp. NBRC 110057]|uniref:NAD(P)H-hydrate epimerase n=1 Tax=Demequina sp. NBRC 110057 TaxID=1570346 RepID=UPI0009FE0A53|nr:NAD(P)H-hydrate epimerase [Demequina sp. NBRC 110057]